MSDYGTEVELVAVTGFVDPGSWEGVALTQDDPEILVEWAGRLCYNTEDKTGSRTGWIKGRIKAGHESVLEHASATFHIKCSRVVTHELVRHRLASYSQRSQRYVKENEPRYIIPPEFEKYERGLFKYVMEECWGWYRKFLELGIKPEIARYVLPNACQTEIVMTMNFRELRHFIKLRRSPRALPEMREVAGKVREICKDLAPEVFEDV